jgi:hypothetical protein
MYAKPKPVRAHDLGAKVVPRRDGRRRVIQPRVGGGTDDGLGAMLCSRTHAINEQPRDTYLARYPKAIGFYARVGDTNSRALCAHCAARFINLGYNLVKNL